MALSNPKVSPGKVATSPPQNGCSPGAHCVCRAEAATENGKVITITQKLSEKDFNSALHSPRLAVFALPARSQPPRVAIFCTRPKTANDSAELLAKVPFFAQPSLTLAATPLTSSTQENLGASSKTENFSIPAESSSYCRLAGRGGRMNNESEELKVKARNEASSLRS